MNVLRMRITVAAVVVGLAAGLIPAPVVAQYACAMSGEVSTSCCCAQKSDDDCPAIERACSCCDVSVTATDPITVAPATVVVAPVPHIGQFTTVESHSSDERDAQLPCNGSFGDAQPPGPALYLQHSCLLC